MADSNRTVQNLKERFAGDIIDVVEFRGETTVTVSKCVVVEILKYLKNSLQFNQLTDLTAVDYFEKKDERFMVVYQLLSLPRKERLRIKTSVSEEECKISTVVDVWTAANWLEREVYDLFGIEFENHPDLRRILMTDDWEGHPLRKDYPLQGTDREPYKGRLS